jgi:hypothetical protein
MQWIQTALDETMHDVEVSFVHFGAGIEGNVKGGTEEGIGMPSSE